MTYIYAGAFEGCTSLTEIELPSTLKAVYADAFKDSGLTNVKLNGTKIPTIASNAFGDTVCQIEIPAGSYDSYISQISEQSSTVQEYWASYIDCLYDPEYEETDSSEDSSGSDSSSEDSSSDVDSSTDSSSKEDSSSADVDSSDSSSSGSIGGSEDSSGDVGGSDEPPVAKDGTYKFDIQGFCGAIFYSEDETVTTLSFADVPSATFNASDATLAIRFGSKTFDLSVLSTVEQYGFYTDCLTPNEISTSHGATGTIKVSLCVGNTTVDSLETCKGLTPSRLTYVLRSENTFAFGIDFMSDTGETYYTTFYLSFEGQYNGHTGTFSPVGVYIPSCRAYLEQYSNCSESILFNGDGSYQLGYAQGDIDGYDRGYEEGSSDTMNMASFFSSLLTICIILAVVKLIL